MQVGPLEKTKDGVWEVVVDGERVLVEIAQAAIISALLTVSTKLDLLLKKLTALYVTNLWKKQTTTLAHTDAHSPARTLTALGLSALRLCGTMN